jgi:hypothetical protein
MQWYWIALLIVVCLLIFWIVGSALINLVRTAERATRSDYSYELYYSPSGQRVFPINGRSGIVANNDPKIGETIIMLPFISYPEYWGSFTSAKRVFLKRVADVDNSGTIEARRFTLRYTEADTGANAEWEGPSGVTHNESEAIPLYLARTRVL